jgi:hypothetical protein
MISVKQKKVLILLASKYLYSTVSRPICAFWIGICATDYILTLLLVMQNPSVANDRLRVLVIYENIHKHPAFQNCEKIPLANAHTLTSYARKHQLCPSPRKIIQSTKIVKWHSPPQAFKISLIFHTTIETCRYKHAKKHTNYSLVYNSISFLGIFILKIP